MIRPLVFLDFDDVICLNSPYGGYDVLEAYADSVMSGVPVETRHALWGCLFDTTAKRHLKLLNEEYSPVYVLSTSWRWFFDRDMLVQTLQLGGLGFVASNLHDDWCTPQISRSAHRIAEVTQWLSRHPEAENQWVVLDDEVSCTGLFIWNYLKREFVLMCWEGKGLQEYEFRIMQRLLELRRSGSTWPE